MLKRFFSWMSIILIVGILLPGCSSTARFSVPRPPLKVEFSDWPGDYTLLVAEEKGFFARHGVKVETLFYKDFDKVIPDLSAAKIDISLLAIGDVISASQAADVRVIAVYDSGGTSAVVAQSSVADI